MSRRSLRKRSLRFESLEGRRLLAPIAFDSNHTVLHNTSLSYYASGYEEDPEAGPVTFSLLSQPGSGSVSMDSSGNFTYTPMVCFVGVDTFDFEVASSLGAASATVTIFVTNTEPDVYDSFQSVLHDQSLSSYVSVSDLDGDAVTVSLLSGPSGTVNMQPDGSYTYEPPAGFIGQDSFNFEASDGIAAVNGTVNINVYNTAPDASSGSTTVDYDTLTSGYVSGSDSDGDSVTFQLVDGPDNAESFGFNSDGTFEYKPSWGWVGEDGFTFTVTDGLAISVIVTMFLQVQNPLNQCTLVGNPAVVNTDAKWFTDGPDGGIFDISDVTF
jgi:hypothetical protein